MNGAARARKVSDCAMLCSAMFVTLAATGVINSSGSTYSTAARAKMAPAVCRMIAPMPRPMSAISAG